MAVEWCGDRMYSQIRWWIIASKKLKPLKLSSHHSIEPLLIFSKLNLHFRKLAELLRKEKILYMHFPALAINGTPTTFRLFTPKAYDACQGVAYLIQNKFNATELIGSSMGRPVTATMAAQLMAGVGCGHPSTWMLSNNEVFDVDNFFADILPTLQPSAIAKTPKIKTEPFFKLEPTNRDAKQQSKPRAPVPLSKRSLFAEGEEGVESSFGNGDYVSDGDEIFGATSPLDDDCRTSSSASSSAMDASPVAQVPAAKRLRKGK